MTINPTPDVNCTYGAPMGRASRNAEPEGPVTLKEIPLPDGYDNGGAYWGLGEPLYWAGDDEGALSTFFRAKDREAAKAHILGQYPDATFAPVALDESDISAFFRAYMVCALWSSCGDEGNPLDDMHDESDISETTRAEMETDCRSFLGEHGETIARIIETKDYSWYRAGHDFWLTRNGYGAGFWDRGFGDDGDNLTLSAQVFGSVDLYVGDDGKVHA